MIRFGIIGSNFIVDSMISSARKIDGVEISAIYSRSREKGEEFSRKHGIENVFTDLDEMIASKKIDAIYIASPNSLHCSQSIKFLENKIPVLCEKAVASNVRELKEMISASEKNNTLFMEAIRNIHNPTFKRIRDNLESIGKIRGGVGIYCQYSSRYDKFKNGIIENAFKLELSNGSLVDIGIYPLYFLVTLFGEPKEIIGRGELLNTGVDCAGVVTLKYEDFSLNVHHSKVSNSYIPSEIRGEDGSILIEMISTLKGVKIKYRDGREVFLEENKEENDMYYEILHFVNLIKEKKTSSSENTFENMLLVYGIIEKIRKEVGVIYPSDEV